MADPKNCKRCRGTGWHYGTSNYDSYYCPSCNGTGMAGSPGTLLLIIALWSIVMLWIVYRVLQPYTDLF